MPQTKSEKTATGRIIDEIVEMQVDVRHLVVGSLVLVRQRFAELLEDSEKVNDGITLQFIDAEMEQTDFSESVWETIADLQDLSFRDLHEIEIKDRGEAWDMAVQIRVAVAMRQALIESGVIAEALARGTLAGGKMVAIGKRADLGELAQGVDLKAAVKARLDGDKV